MSIITIAHGVILARYPAAGASLDVCGTNTALGGTGSNGFADIIWLEA